MNLLVSALVTNDKVCQMLTYPLYHRIAWCLRCAFSRVDADSQAIHPARVLHKEQYHAFALRTILDLKIAMGQGIVTPTVIPALKYFA